MESRAIGAVWLTVSLRLLLPKWAAAGAAGKLAVQFNAKEAKMFAHLSQASYCGEDDRLKNWTCLPCQQAGLNVVPGSVRLLSHTEIWEANSTFMYMARVAGAPSSPVDGCILSIRGSETITNWIRDLQAWPFKPHAFDWCDGCFVDYGFYTVWKNAEAEVLAALDDNGCRPRGSVGGDPSGSPHLYITGHSMGAAVATVAMCILQGMGYDVKLSYIFESPRVGNSAFASAFNKFFASEHAVSAWRVTHARDPVVHLPPRVPFDYTHVGYEAWYSDNASQAPVICETGEDPACSAKYDVADTLPFGSDHCSTPLATGSNICDCDNAKGLAATSHETLLI